MSWQSDEGWFSGDDDAGEIFTPEPPQAPSTYDPWADVPAGLPWLVVSDYHAVAEFASRTDAERHAETYQGYASVWSREDYAEHVRRMAEQGY